MLEAEEMENVRKEILLGAMSLPGVHRTMFVSSLAALGGKTYTDIVGQVLFCLKKH